ncbi:MAG TPA: GGDEF domain-containing protein [Xanthobacteraceae bacterium]|nr:GGDEF domain-containing protein [Xanthobacteraceae bacterium]
MDSRTSTYDGYRGGLPVPEPVAVTPWTARLADPFFEHDYRLDRFADDRRRGLLLMVLAGTAGWLQLFIEIYAHARGVTPALALLPPLGAIGMPVVGFLVIRRLRSPDALEMAMIATAAIGAGNRAAVMMLHPHLNYIWPTMMVAVVLVIYLVFPIRFVTSIVIAGIISVVMPTWWALSLGSALPPDQFYRGLVWLLFANALGFIAANSLQRSQRLQYAQSLVLKELLSTDSMTGIGNRRRFDDALDREWRRCGRSGKPLSLLIIDVDHFKAYNDHCGHLQGDECLRRVARLLVGCVGRPGDLVARYGGEEFVCLLPEIGEPGACAVATKLCAVLNQAAIPHPAFAAGARLTISIGVATATDLPRKRPADLVALADKLLYAAKGAGRDRAMAGVL